MISFPYITDTDLERIDSMVKFQPHAVMLELYYGADETRIVDNFIDTLNRYFSVNLIDLEPEPGKKKIAISAIRDLKPKIRNTKSQNQLNLIVIKKFEQLGIEAATAILKVLEEPSSGTMFLLATKNLSNVLATIASRCYKLKLKRPDIKYLSNRLGIESARLKPLMMLSGGRLQILEKLINEHEGSNSERQILEDAKKWAISKDSLDRLEIFDKYQKLDAVENLILAIAGIQKSLIEHFMNNGDQRFIQSLISEAEAVDAIIRDTSSLNLNKRVVQIKLSTL
jgi:hypothetical protein